MLFFKLLKQLICRFYTRLLIYYPILGICTILPLRPIFNKVYVDCDAD